MASWKENPIMFWYDQNAGSYIKITDHNRQPLDITVERIETKNRMANGRLRKYLVAKKRSFATSWTNLPSTNSNGGLTTADGNASGEQIELFCDTYDDGFNMKLRRGDGSEEIVEVMVSEFSKTVAKRGVQVDLWDINITLEEV